MADDGQNRTDDFCGTVVCALQSECVGVHVECVPAGAQGGPGPEVLQGVFQQVDVSGLHAADLWSGDVLDLKQFWKISAFSVSSADSSIRPFAPISIERAATRRPQLGAG